MKLLLLAAIVMLTGLALLLAMVIRLAEPSLAWSLIGYATLCAGIILGLAGAIQRDRSRSLRNRRRSPRSTATPG